MNYRTDMAVENMESDFKYDVNRIINGMNLKKIKVDLNLAKKIHKKEGIYYNLDNIDYRYKYKEIVKIVTGLLYDCLENSNLKEKASILVCGIGNEAATPDALGPLTINKVEVNRHLENNPDKYIVSAFCPRVMGLTGMESQQIIKAIVDDFKVDLLIVVDALACSNAERMCNSIQIATSGLNPGSGVYNNRNEISKKTLGIDVIAIGVPTVSDITCFTDLENNFFVTPKDIDLAMDILSNILAESINNALRK